MSILQKWLRLYVLSTLKLIKVPPLGFTENKDCDGAGGIAFTTQALKDNLENRRTDRVVACYQKVVCLTEEEVGISLLLGPQIWFRFT